MAVSFDILNHDWPSDSDGLSLPPASMFVQISTVNAHDFFCWIGLPDTPLYGEMPAPQLAALYVGASGRNAGNRTTADGPRHTISSGRELW